MSELNHNNAAKMLFKNEQKYVESKNFLLKLNENGGGALHTPVIE